MAEIIWTLEAAQWLEDIYEYIAAESPSSAQKVVTGIYDKIQLLRTHPRLGQIYEAIGDREVREVLYGHYRIAYLVKSEERVESSESSTLRWKSNGTCTSRLKQIQC